MALNRVICKIIGDCELSLNLGDIICLASCVYISFYIFKDVDHLKNESL